MYILRIVNIHEHRSWMMYSDSITTLLDMYGGDTYQRRQWQIEIRWLDEQNREIQDIFSIIAEMRSGRWHVSPFGSQHFEAIGYYPVFPQDRR